MSEPRLSEAWDGQAQAWIAWVRQPELDSYWRFHRAAFLPLVPDPGRLTVDLGCGEGRVSRDLAAMGHTVLGLDASPAMVAAAAAHPDAGGRYAVADATRLPLPNDGCDGVTAFMCLHDIDDLAGTVGEIARILEPDGRLTLAIVHPLNSAGEFVGTSGDPDRPFVLTDSWFTPRHYSDRAERDGLTMTFHSIHRPLQHYTDALAGAGFRIERLAEATDPNPGTAIHRIPMFLHIRAVLVS